MSDAPQNPNVATWQTSLGAARAARAIALTLCRAGLDDAPDGDVAPWGNVTIFIS